MHDVSALGAFFRPKSKAGQKAERLRVLVQRMVPPTTELVLGHIT